MILRHSSIVLGALLLLATGCATSSRVDTVSSEADQARRIAEQALNTANEALNAANDARNTAQGADTLSRQNEQVLNKHFRRSMLK